MIDSSVCPVGKFRRSTQASGGGAQRTLSFHEGCHNVVALMELIAGQQLRDLLLIALDMISHDG